MLYTYAREYGGGLSDGVSSESSTSGAKRNREAVGWLDLETENAENGKDEVATEDSGQGMLWDVSY